MLLKLLVILFACMQFSSFLPLAYAGELEDSRSTVGTSTSTHPIKMGRRLMFHASGRFWIFYQYALTYWGYRSSLDGNTWSTVTFVAQAGATAFSTFYDNSTYLYIAYGASGGAGGGYYIRGVPNSDGTITWDATGSFYVGGWTVSGVSIAVNSSGNAFVGYRVTGNNGDMMLNHNSLANGSWNDASGFPIIVNSTATSNGQTIVLMLENQNVSYLYTRHFSPPNQYIASYIYFMNNASISPYEQASNYYYSSSSGDCNFGAVAVGNDVYLTYFYGPVNPMFTRRTWGNSTWPTHNETSVRNLVNGQTACVLSYDYLHNRIYIIKNSLTPDAFVLNVTYYDLNSQTHTVAELVYDNGNYPNNNFLQCSYMVYNNTIGIAYVYPSVTPYTVRHVFYDFYTAPPPPATIYPIRLTMGLLGLLFIISSPVIAAREVKKRKNYGGFILGVVIFTIGYALVCCWMY